MRSNVYEFIKLVSKIHNREPIIEFGSFVIPGHKSPRKLFGKKKYIGCDVKKGEGVDRVEDCTKSSFKSSTAGTVLICETMEHVEQPWLITPEARRVLKSNGLLLITAPFIFPVHMLPDYWRISPQCLAKQLSIFKHSLVFWQGEYNIPHTVFGLATDKAIVIERIKNYLFKNLSSIPGSREGEQMFMWEGQKIFVDNWYRNVVQEDQWYNEISGRRGRK